MPRYRLEPLVPSDATRWDELIAPYEGRQLFHRRAWLAYLADSRGIDIQLWAIREGTATVGYFCGGFLKKGPYRILGSPLEGWGTNFMGPAAARDIGQRDFLDALDLLAREEHLALIELEHPALDDAPLASAGYTPTTNWTYVVALAPDQHLMWSTLHSTCRNRIRKAGALGLTVEAVPDPAIADLFYDQFSDVLRLKRLVPPYPRACPRKLFQHLHGANLIFALRVRDGKGRVLATGLFPHDDRSMYFWGGASWITTRELCPNECLHWAAMSLAAQEGVAHYNMCGPGQFKRKFGGTLHAVRRWRKYYSPAARWARRAYAFYFRKKIRVDGWYQALTRSSKEN